MPDSTKIRRISIKKKFSKLQIVAFALLAGGLSVSMAQAKTVNMLVTRKVVVKRSMSGEAGKCVECHTKKTPGLVDA